MNYSEVVVSHDSTVSFDGPHLLSMLEDSPLERTDDLPFGLIVMDREGTVIWYNEYESQRAGLGRDRVEGRNFFTSVGPCTNNYLIAQRYLDEPDLDDFLDFVFTLRMAPTPVKLRLMARSGSPRQYLAVLPT
jgi:photoactive yellow protein